MLRGIAPSLCAVAVLSASLAVPASSAVHKPRPQTTQDHEDSATSDQQDASAPSVAQPIAPRSSEALKPPAKNDGDAHEHGDKPFWEEWEFWTAFGTIGLGIATLWLVFKTDGLIKSAEGSAERQLRAYVTVMLRGVEVDPAQNGHAAIQIYNRGQTPAHDLAVYWTFSVAPKEPTREAIDWIDSKATCLKEERFVLGPNEDRGADCYVKPLSDDEALAVLEDREWLYVVGRVEYFDAFKKPRITRFCHIYSGLDLGSDGGRYGHYGNSCT